MISKSVQGLFKQLIYSPRGEIEGILLHQDGTPLQVVFDKHDKSSPAAFESATEGQEVLVDAIPAKPSSKGDSEHPVYAFQSLQSIDGVKPTSTANLGKYGGTIVRFNYARHGAPNGFVLDTGDFIHTKPQGFAALRLSVGDAVEADGPAQRLTTGHGWAVDAVVVNGEDVRRN